MITHALMQELKDEIIECGNVAEYYVKHDKLQVITKSDGSPVSNGDMEVSAKLTFKLSQLFKFPIISEEGDQIHLDSNVNSFWLIDPIDGTYKYIKADPHYTINVGLILSGEPKYGFIYRPSDKMMHYVDLNNKLAIEQDGFKLERIVRKDSDPITGLLPDKNEWRERSIEFLNKYNVNKYNPYSGSSKFTEIAHGHADLYAKMDICMEWDVAAGHAILNAIGGGITDRNYCKLAYGKENFIVPNFIAFNERWLPYIKSIGMHISSSSEIAF